MYEFDEYINSIIGDLKINKKKKHEMIEEFRDHLQMLKLEYMSNGISENEAVIKAIDNFGHENLLKKIFTDSLSNYRNYITVFTGIILLLLLYIIGNHIPVRGVDPNQGSSLLPSLSIVIISLFIPFGYFIPVILQRVKKASLIAIITLPIGVFIGICFSVITRSSIHIDFIIECAIFSLLGSMIGYTTLIIINRVSLIFTHSILKKS
jgi:hypothetical protein